MDTLSTAISGAIVPRVVDLNAISASLTNPKYGKFRRALKSAAIAQSCLSDLKQAHSQLAALAQLLDRGDVPHGSPEALAHTAMLMASVLLYARATGTGGGKGERGAIGIRERLTVPQRDDHDALLRIRNRAIAHVHSDERIDENIWSEVHMLAVERSEGWLPGGATRSLQLSTSTLRRLHRAIPVAIGIVEANAQEKITRISAALNEAGVPTAVFEENLIDPAAIFGGPEQGTQAVNAAEIGGSTSFFTSHECR